MTRAQAGASLAMMIGAAWFSNAAMRCDLSAAGVVGCLLVSLTIWPADK